MLLFCIWSPGGINTISRMAGQGTDLKVIAQVNSNLIFADNISGEMVQQITGTTELGQDFMTRYTIKPVSVSETRLVYYNLPYNSLGPAVVQSQRCPKVTKNTQDAAYVASTPSLRNQPRINPV